MKDDFPQFNTFVSSLDIKEELEKYFEAIKEKQRKEIIPLGLGVNIVVEKALPPNSALFIDQENRVVAVYKDGRLVCSAWWGGRVEKPMACDIRPSLKKSETAKKNIAEEADRWVDG